MKILTILGATVITATLFLNTNSLTNSNQNLGLAGLITMNYFNPNGPCDNSTTQPDAYCKNTPAKNCGYCVVYLSKTSCKPSSAQNKDCYDVGF